MSSTMNRTVWAVAAAVSLLLGGVGPAAAAEVHGTLVGQLTLAGEPLAEATLVITGSALESGYTTVTSNDDGRYAVELPAGKFHVLVQSDPEDFVDTSSTYFGDTTRGADAEPVRVSAGATVTADIAVQPAGSMVGTVRTVAGTAVRTTVELHNLTRRALSTSGTDEVHGAARTVVWAQTDPSGTFRAGDLPSGRWEVRVPGAHPFTTVVRDGRHAVAADVTVKKAGQVRGRVARAFLPTNHGSVVLYRPGSATPSYSVRLRPGKSRAFTLRGVVPGAYDLYVTGRGKVARTTVRPGATTKVGTIKARTGATIKGTVKGYGGRSLVGTVTVTDAAGRPVGYAHTSGAYTVKRLPKGKLTLSVHPSGASKDIEQIVRTAQTRLSKTSKVNLRLGKRASVTGRVLHDGRPVARIKLTIGGRSGRTDAQGRFTISYLPPGRNVLVVHDSLYPGGYRTKEITVRLVAGKRTTAPDVTVTR